MTHLLDTHVWVQRAAGEPLPILVEETLRDHAETLAIADISIWEVAIDPTSSRPSALLRGNGASTVTPRDRRFAP